MCRHRLTDEFPDIEGVRYFNAEGQLFNTSDEGYTPFTSVNRFLEVGELW